MAEELLTVEEVAAKLHISIRTLRQEIARHNPPVIAAGRRKLFDDGAFRFLIEALRVNKPAAPEPRRRKGRSRVGSVDEAYDRAMALANASLENARQKSPPSKRK